jgi:branched-chain amino acid transport system substrate-binding protein
VPLPSSRGTGANPGRAGTARHADVAGATDQAQGSRAANAGHAGAATARPGWRRDGSFGPAAANDPPTPATAAARVSIAAVRYDAGIRRRRRRPAALETPGRGLAFVLVIKYLPGMPVSVSKLRWRKSMKTLALAGAIVLAVAGSAAAQTPVKIGMITTLTTPGGYLGEDVRDAFRLAIDEEGGKLGGVPVQLIVEDDNLKPANGKQIADKMLEQDKIKLFTGIIFSNVAGATVPTVLEAGAFYVSPNAGPSNFAGKDCNRNYFVVSWQNDNLHESAGQNAQNLGYRRMVLLAPNYQAGKDALAGFKRMYKGEVLEEIYTKLDQTDFAPEMARVRALKPDAVFQFHPGGAGIAFMKQYAQAGLTETTPLVVAAPSMEPKILSAVGDVAIGVNVTSHWNNDFPNPASQKFVKDYTAKFNRVPTPYAQQGYDTAKLIGSALKAVNGDLSREDAFRAALKKADFVSTRGAFRFNTNNHPIQDWWALKVEKGADGKPAIVTKTKVLSNHADVYAKDCKM